MVNTSMQRTLSLFVTLFAFSAIGAVGCGGTDDIDLPGGELDAGGGGGGGRDGAAPKPDGGRPPPSATYAIGGTVSGLGDATGLTLSLNGGSGLSVTADGPFAFPTKVTEGAAYAVTILSQPVGKTCQISAGSGVVAKADVDSVVVNCDEDTFTIGGSISGLADDATVTLANGGATLVRNANGIFAFPTPVPTGTAYDVTVSLQPSSPVQVCTVEDGAGTVGTANVTDIKVTCVTSTFTVGGTLTGLEGDEVVLQNGGGDDLTLNADGTFTFTTEIDSGADYAVTVLAHPSGPTQECTVTSGTGTVDDAPITNVAVTCATKSFTIGGELVGLDDGKQIVLQNNGGDDLAVTADGTFAFDDAVKSGEVFDVTILTQPAGQICKVVAGAGTVTNDDVSSVVVNCKGLYDVSGTTTGLEGTVSLTLHDAADALVDEVQVSTGSFAFSVPLEDGTDYKVAISSQPSTPSQQCVVTNDEGTVSGADVTNVLVTCTTNAFFVGGSVAGLAPGSSVILQNNGGDDRAVTANGDFQFGNKVASGSAYKVTVKTHPTSPIAQECAVTNGSGTVGGGDVNNVTIACTTRSFPIEVTVSGLGAGSLDLKSGDDLLKVTENGMFSFGTAVESGEAYAVTVAKQPSNPTQICTVADATGTVGNAPVALAVTCVTQRFSVGGKLVGLETGKQLVLTNNGGDDLTLTEDGDFAFDSPVLSGADFDVEVAAQPDGQVCRVTNGKDKVGNGAGPETQVRVNCTNLYSVGGVVRGLANGNTLRLRNGAETIGVVGGGGDIGFTFTDLVEDGKSYAVSVVAAEPDGDVAQICAVEGTTGTGNVNGADVTSVEINCTTKAFKVQALVSGHQSITNVTDGTSALTLRNNGADDLDVTGNGTHPFVTEILSGESYSVTVWRNPTNPAQTCTVTSGSGTIGKSDVTVEVTCARTTVTVGGTLYGLAEGKSIVIQNNAAGDLTLNGPSSGNTTSFTFPVQPNGSPYDITIFTQPANGADPATSQICKVQSTSAHPSSGTIPPFNPTNIDTVQIYCGRTCESRRDAGDTSSGRSSIEPGGQASGDSFDAQCDMASLEGGWTLLLKTRSGPASASTSTIPANGLVTNYGRLSDTRVEALARVSSQVHVRNNADTVIVSGFTATRHATSVPDALPILNLRELRVLNFGVPVDDSAVQQSYWTVGGGLNVSIFDFDAAPEEPSSTWPSVYRAQRASGGGFNFYGSNNRAWGDNARPARVYVK